MSIKKKGKKYPREITESRALHTLWDESMRPGNKVSNSRRSALQDAKPFASKGATLEKITHLAVLLLRKRDWWMFISPSK